MYRYSIQAFAFCCEHTLQKSYGPRKILIRSDDTA